MKNGEVEAADIQGDAATSKKEAEDALVDLKGVSAKKAKKLTASLFGADDSAAADEGTNKEADIPRQGDGSNIENIYAYWITADTVDNGDDRLLYVKPSDDETHSVRLQVAYELSGEHNYEPGDVTITVPAHIFTNRDGKPYGNEIIPYPEDPSTKGDFNWKLVGDNYVLTNTKRMSAATKGFIQFAFADLVPHELVDMAVSKPFDAYIEVVTYKGNTIAARSNDLVAQFDTQAIITNASKRVYGSVQRVKASEITIPKNLSDEQKAVLKDEQEFIKVNWYVWGATKANTRYTLGEIDTIPQDQVVVTEDGVEKTEAEFHGFVLGATSEDGTQLDKGTVYTGHGDGQTNYYYYSTAYPASQFKPDTTYTFHNSIQMTVTEVDPDATTVNPNVDNGEYGGKADPQLVTTKTASARTSWSYTNPKWYDPTGHFMVVKNGNDDHEQHGTATNNYTHYPSYSSSYSDLHIWATKSPINGWYGIYPSGINDLQDIATGRDADHDGIRLSYTIDSVGYVMPWMFDAKSFDRDGSVASRMSTNYTRPVTITTTDTGVSIGRHSEKLKVGQDYDFVSIEFPESPWLYTGVPQNINPDGSWIALTAGDGTFKYTRDYDRSHWPDITLQVQLNDEWQTYAVASWKTGTLQITPDAAFANARVDGAVIDLPEGTQNFRTNVTLKNDDEYAKANNAALQAAIDYDVRTVINLKSTEAMQALIDAGFEKSNTPEMFVYNSVNMLAERADLDFGDADKEIVSLDKDGYDSIRGYTTDTAVYPTKTSKQSMSDVNYEDRTVTVHYTAKVEERSVIGDKATYEQAIADGRLVTESHGYWHDLLPKGMTPVVSTIKLRANDSLVDAYTIENYKGTGRTMLVVEADLTPTPQRYRSGDMYYYEDVPTISFDATIDFESLHDYGVTKKRTKTNADGADEVQTIHNVIAFESSNDFMGTIENYTGEADNTSGTNNVATKQAFENDDEKDAMNDLVADREDPSFVYAGVYTDVDYLSSARTSLSKDVQVNNDGWWSSGVWYTQATPEATQRAMDEAERVVYEGGQYSYRLRMMSDDGTISKNLVLYDSLENFHAGDYTPENGNSDIDLNAEQWKGSFRSVDVSQLVEAGCAPVVYYSTVDSTTYTENGTEKTKQWLVLSSEADSKKYTPIEENIDLTNSAVWSTTPPADLSKVTGIAVDASKRADGSDFELQPMETAVVIINMQAPSGDAARDYIQKSGAWGRSAYAYNNAYMKSTAVDASTLETQDGFVRKDYTKVGLMEYKYEVNKVWNDDDNRDGKRAGSVTMRLYADGMDTGKTIELSEQNEWHGSFNNIPYTDGDGNKIRYSVKEDVPDGYDSTIKVNSDTNATITNTHESERTQVRGTKTWEGDTEDVRPDSVTLQLYKMTPAYLTPRLVTSQVVKPDAEGNWEYSFDNLYKYENGVEVDYTVREVVPTSGKGASYVANTVDNLNYRNVYHPYGDLVVTKAVEDVTTVSAEREFTFNFEFTQKVDGEDEPVFNEYAYEVLDADNNKVSEGTVSTGGTVKIKGGQSIHVKDVDEWVNYKVTEDSEAGFTLVSSSKTSGTIQPNATQTASFTNRYAANGSINLTAQKLLKNRELQRYQFRFELYQVTMSEDGQPVAPEELVRTASNARPDKVTNRDDGTVESSEATVTFGALRYTQEDAGKSYLYRIDEMNLEKPGYTYDKVSTYVRVDVVDNGDGTLEVIPTYTKDGQTVDQGTFENEYKAEGEIVLRAWKDLQGRKLKDNEFTFELLDEVGKVIDTAKNTADGTVAFKAIKYNQTDIGKTYNYAVREVAGSDNTVNYDDSVFGYTVEVLDNGDGTLSMNQGTATPIYESNDACDQCKGKGTINLDTQMNSGGDVGSIIKRVEDINVSALRGDGMPIDYFWADRTTNPFNDYLTPIVKRAAALGSVEWGTAENRPSRWGIPEDAGYPEVVTAQYITKITYAGNDSVMDDLIHAYASKVYKEVAPQEYRSSEETYDVDKFVRMELDLTGGYEPRDPPSSTTDIGWVVYKTHGKFTLVGRCGDCEGDGKNFEIVGWNTEEGELPVFTNTLKPGSLSVTKTTTNAESADPNQEFNFKVKLIGEGIEDGEKDYAVSAADANSAPITKRDTTVNIQDGEFEFSLRGGEKATFSDIPAGTAYQVWEETPDGWVLIEQSNVSGNIEPLQTAEAKFTNRYQPGTTTAQFNGTKTLDGQAAEKSAYSFQLTEDGNANGKVKVLGADGAETEATLPITVSTLEGGFVQFPTIVYTKDNLGKHTYRITEVDPNDNTIDYDTHTETVEVAVSDDGKGNLSSTTKYDTDGIKFANKTRPGNLEIKKSTTAPVTSANKDDEFTFKVTLQNEKGMLLGSDDEIYWYTKDAKGNIVQPETANENGGGTLPNMAAAILDLPRMALQALDSLLVQKAYAATDLSSYPASSATVSQSGTYGTTTWELYSDGTLVIRPTSGSEGSMPSFAYHYNYTGADTQAPWNTVKTSIYRVKTMGTIHLGQLSAGLFYGCINMQEADLSGFDMSQVQEIGKMFMNCRSLRSIDLSMWDTSNMTNITGVSDGLFEGCSTLVNVDLSGWDTSHVTSFYSLFENCTNLVDVNLDGWDTSNVTSLVEMFGRCNKLESVDVSDWNTSKVTNTIYMFRDCFALKNVDVSSWDTSKIQNMQSMFGDCRNLKALDVSGWNTSSLLYAGGMFYNCRNLTELDVSGWDTSKIQVMSGGGYSPQRGMFQLCSGLKNLDTSNWIVAKTTDFTRVFSGCSQLESLDLSGFNTLSATNMNGMFGSCSKLQKITLPSSFSFKGKNITTVSNQALLPAPPSTLPYTGKWIREDKSVGPYTAESLRDAYKTSFAGTWVWDIDSSVGVVDFDANGGYTSASRIVATSASQSVTIPTATRLHYILTGWNTMVNGSGMSYTPGIIATNVVKPGSITVLYAQWEATDLRDYQVRHYQQNTTLNGYSLVSTENLQADKGTMVTPQPKTYSGFAMPQAKSAVVLDDDSLVIDYYYDRAVYDVVFNGNDSTSGQMANQKMVGGISSTLNKNNFQKTGAIFTGWNTQADGNGTPYADRQSVVNLSSEDGATVTLYAQWLANDNEALEPTNGVITVTCKAGETIVIPGLPAGTTYTVEEVDMPNAWKQTGTVGTNGTVIANATQNATITNTYEAVGSVYLMAHKKLQAEELQAGQFSFQLVGPNGNVLQTVTNEALDTNATVVDNDGNDADNPWKGTAPVVFDAINYTQADIGKTYTYTIKEVAGNDAKVVYDSHTETVEVAVEDAGKGNLKTTVIYDDDGALFTNRMDDTDLKIYKTTEGATADVDDQDFEFTVSLKDADGKALDGIYNARKYTRDYKLVDTTETVTKYAHTPNINDSGVANGMYANYLANRQIVSIPGAKRLNITVKYATENSWDGLYVYQGSNTNTIQRYMYNYYKYLTGPGSGYTAAVNTSVFEISGDTATFCFTSDGSAQSYGYYAVITAEIGGVEEEGYEDLEISDGSKVTLKGNERIEVYDLPHGATYEVTEQSVDNWEQTAAEGDTGTLHAGAVSEARFTNTYTPPEPEPYAANGAVQLAAKKVVDGGTILEDDDFTFQLLNEDGDVLQTKGVDEFGGTESTVTFDKIAYTQDDLTDADGNAVKEKTFTYYIQEKAGTDENIAYDKTVYEANVTVTDDGAGNLVPTVAYNSGYETDANGNETAKTLAQGDVPTFTNEFLKARVAGAKTWNDTSNVEGFRPDSITVNLLQNGTKIDSKNVTADDNWQWAWEGLPKVSGGRDIVYTVEEEPVEGYEAAVEGYDITNSREVEQTQVSIIKAWSDADNQDGIRPGMEEFAGKVHLLANGEEVKGAAPQVTANEDGTWTLAWTDLQKYADAKEIAYTVAEDAIDGYTASADAVADGETLTNVHEPATVDVKGIKVWDDSDNAEGLRPRSIVVRLKADGEDAASQRVEAAADGSWSFAFEGLPKFADGKEIAYTVTEDAVEGYSAAFSGSAADGFTIRNSRPGTEIDEPDTPTSPSTPTVTTEETDETIDDGDTPKTAGDTPSEETTVTEEETPTAPATPSEGDTEEAVTIEDEDEESIDDEDTPLGAPVRTGDVVAGAAGAALVVALAAGVLALLVRRRREQ